MGILRGRPYSQAAYQVKEKYKKWKPLKEATHSRCVGPPNGTLMILGTPDPPQSNNWSGPPSSEVLDVLVPAQVVCSPSATNFRSSLLQFTPSGVRFFFLGCFSLGFAFAGTAFEAAAFSITKSTTYELAGLPSSPKGPLTIQLLRPSLLCSWVPLCRLCPLW